MWLTSPPVVAVPRAVAVHAVRALATVDYTVANAVSDGVADVVSWAYAHDAAWLPPLAMRALQGLDETGSLLIALVAWLVHHAP